MADHTVTIQFSGDKCGIREAAEGASLSRSKDFCQRIEPTATQVRHIRQMANEGDDRVHFEWLALRCQTGDPEAFADLIAIMERPLLYYATSLTGNQDAGLDVLQDVWLRVVRGIRRLKDTGSLKPWLYAITHGVAVDRIRRDYRRDKAEQAQLDDAFNIDEPSFDEEDATAIRDALSRLGVKQREVLVLHFLQDLSILEIANVVGCSEGTVKSRIHYAKRQIKQILEGVKHGTAIK
jgi:RNA polymerase sigma factor, sigma-70 family